MSKRPLQQLLAVGLFGLIACSPPSWHLEDEDLLQTVTVPAGVTETWRAAVTLSAQALATIDGLTGGHGELEAFVELRLADPTASPRPVALRLTGVNSPQTVTVTVTAQKTAHSLTGFGLSDCVPDIECLRTFDLQVVTPSNVAGGVVASGAFRATFHRDGDRAPEGADLAVETSLPTP